MCDLALLRFTLQAMRDLGDAAARITRDGAGQ